MKQENPPQNKQTKKNPKHCKTKKSPTPDYGHAALWSSGSEDQRSFLLLLLSSGSSLMKKITFFFCSQCSFLHFSDPSVLLNMRSCNFLPLGEEMDSVRNYFSTNSFSMTGIKAQQLTSLQFQTSFHYHSDCQNSYFYDLTAILPRLCSTAPCSHFISFPRHFIAVSL